MKETFTRFIARMQDRRQRRIDRQDYEKTIMLKRTRHLETEENGGFKPQKKIKGGKQQSTLLGLS